MGLIKSMLGPRRDDPDVVTLRQQVEREQGEDGWTDQQAVQASAAAARLGPAVTRMIEREGRR